MSQPSRLLADRLISNSMVVASCLLAAILLMPEQSAAQAVVALRGATIETGTSAGQIAGGTIIVRDGRIEAVGTDLDIPVTAQVVDLHGKTIMPGIVDPYFVIQVGQEESQPAFREVTFGGRTFRIPISPAAAPTSFTRIVDGFDPRSRAWWDATRSGITTAHLVAEGVGESVIGLIQPDNPEDIITDAEGQLFIALTNQSSSLQVLRKGLADPNAKGGGSSGSSSAERMAQMRARMGRGGRPAGPPTTASPTSSSSRSSSSSANKSPEDKLWDAVRTGKQPIFVNVNNASSILYLAGAVKEAEQTKVVLVASGDDLYRTLSSLDGKKYTVVMPPRIDLIPNSQDRINVANMLQAEKIKVAFSLSLNQGDFRSSQDSPLFPVAMLVRSGLDRQTAIRGLTSLPAELLGLEKEVGSIEKGRRANFVVFDEDPFSATANIVQVLVDGRPIYEN
ncbi:amidohydrolase family protein [Planctomycetaceae bacterium SH139]